MNCIKLISSYLRLASFVTRLSLEYGDGSQLIYETVQREKGLGEVLSKQ
jgi:hypothetical protein